MTVDGTGFNPAQGATYADMAAYLSAHSGLDYHVALNWLKAEGSQQRGNPLGVNWTAAHGPTYYSSWQAGLDAAVALLKRSTNYAGIIRAIRGGSPAAERQAIVDSPWSGTTYAHGAHFSTAGIPGAGSDSLSRNIADGASNITLPAPALGGFGNSISFPVGHIITAADVDAILAALVSSGQIDPGGSIAGSAAYTHVHEILRGHIGQAWNKGLQDTLQREILGQAAAAGDPLAGVGAAIAGIPGALAGVAVTLGLLGVIAVLGWSGAKDLLGD